MKSKVDYHLSTIFRKKTDGPMFLSLAALFRYGLFADRKGSEKKR